MHKALSLLTMLPFILDASGAPIFIATVGKTEDVSQIVPKVKLNASQLPAAKPTQSLVNMLYTVHSRLLTVGKIKFRQLSNKEKFTPIFLLGADSQSITWLNKYKKKLQAIEAKGFLVNISGRGEYNKFVKATGMHLAPISGDAIAQHFSISHYPVLITPKLIEQ